MPRCLLNVSYTVLGVLEEGGSGRRAMVENMAAGSADTIEGVQLRVRRGRRHLDRGPAGRRDRRGDQPGGRLGRGERLDDALLRQEEIDKAAQTSVTDRARAPERSARAAIGRAARGRGRILDRWVENCIWG
jgi:hypothetical protein